MLRRILPILVVLCGLLWNRTAHATHFRYGTINWNVPNPAQPLTVNFTVSVAWRSAMPDSTVLQFGDGSPNNPATQGSIIGTGTDASGQMYTVYEYSVLHTYPAASTYTAQFTGCCRLTSLQNGGGGNVPYTVQTVVDLSNGNTGGPVSLAPAVIQMQVGGVRTYLFPAFDPDGDPITCRFATSAETGLPAGQEVPAAVPTLIKPTLSQACLVTWDLNGAAFVDQYVLHIILESSHSGKVSSTAIDLIVETVNAPPPTCAGSGTFIVPVGQAFSHTTTGTNTGGGNLTMNGLNAPMGSTFVPVSGTTQASPFTSTFAWTPSAAFAGTTQIVAVNYTNTQNLTGTCYLTIQVPSCANYGTPCSAGVGACMAMGINVCQGPNTVCNAVPGMPSPEVCDGQDNDCNGMTDEGFNVGQPCTNGVGACKAMGTIECVGGGTAACNAVPGMPMPEICGNQIDEDCDGKLDNGCPDTDGDGIPDAVEIAYGTDPNDADSDDDGVLDGQEPNWNQDSDGDGLINALDPDSDNDGLFDGTEMGKDCNNPATDKSKNHCIPDADPSTTTDPLNRDTDNGGASDGSEDWNRNGKVDPGETDPTAGHGADDSMVVDTDGDGLGDKLEIAIHSNPNDADTDDDGLLDGQEPNPTCDDDHDGLIDVLDADSDNDALFDGTEMGQDCSNKDTDKSKMCCIPDADDGFTRTSPLLKDTDHGGVSDGSEDFNRNGKVDPGETDPTAGHGADDSMVVDTDGDGLSDGLEATLGSNPNDADTDDDGTPDGQEANPGQDVDGDGKIDVLDPDSDGDGIFDGTEQGFPCKNPPTDPNKNTCVPDADMGKTTTSPINPDTDFGGVKDGVEDGNHNGQIDSGETDPNDPADDMPCMKDSDCGGPMSGKVCEMSKGVCENGCRGMGGNGCPNPKVCTSMDTTIGTCVDCNTNADCPNGQVCNMTTHMCGPGCTMDSDCGGPTSGHVCDDSTHACVNGCRGTGGNGCPDPQKCTSTDNTVGMCVQCAADSDCGGENSGMICNTETHMCGPGCRGSGGNACPTNQVCSSKDMSPGTCGTPPIVVAEGNGILCSARPANDNESSLGWIMSGALGLLLAARRRRRR